MLSLAEPLLASQGGQGKVSLEVVRAVSQGRSDVIRCCGHLCSGDRNWHTFVRVGDRHLTEEARVGSRFSSVGVVEGNVGLGQVFLPVSLLRSFAVRIIAQMFLSHALSFLLLRSKVLLSVSFPKSLQLRRAMSLKLC